MCLTKIVTSLQPACAVVATRVTFAAPNEQYDYSGACTIVLAVHSVLYMWWRISRKKLIFIECYETYLWNLGKSSNGGKRFIVLMCTHRNKQ